MAVARRRSTNTYIIIIARAALEAWTARADEQWACLVAEAPTSSRSHKSVGGPARSSCYEPAGKYKGCRESQRMLEPAESEGNEAARAALVCKLYSG